MHALLFECGGLLILVPIASLVLGTSLVHFGALAMLLSACAMLSNMVYQQGFEWLEARFSLRRTLVVRLLHTAGFEAFFTAVALPLTVWWLSMAWLDALLLDLAMTGFFLVYTFSFNWLYDLVRSRLR